LLFDKATLTGCTKLATVAHMLITTEYSINKLQYDNKTLVLGIKGLRADKFYLFIFTIVFDAQVTPSESARVPL
jgi:hypothetical protein